ncbi:hypothetical protein llap_12362 [Limosa lapponica baueri]|uniref:Uncharacterized protein n=1 Tax=Limosa lapponica baueri TaxID=1758121 RepID=A0A2I0TU39_LIMLA|nr:hypothetical protein llap_12362 [Limosa lapponica baueri]
MTLSSCTITSMSSADLHCSNMPVAGHLGHCRNSKRGAMRQWVQLPKEGLIDHCWCCLMLDLDFSSQEYDFPRQPKPKRKQSFYESARDYPWDEDPLQESRTESKECEA